MSKSDVKTALGVSCETFTKLEAYVGLLQKWSRAINLLAAQDEDEIWHRHILDCGQITQHAPDSVKTWIDIGSGAGLPGLVCALMLQGQSRSVNVTLVEVDQRKAAFLREASRVLDVHVTIKNNRTEEIAAEPYDIISARAVAPLNRLLSLSERFSGPSTVFLFLKGEKLPQEIAIANEDWQFAEQRIESLTNSSASLLRLTDLRRLQ